MIAAIALAVVLCGIPTALLGALIYFVCKGYR